MKLKVFYGEDPESQGFAFFWPTSPAKRKELLSVKRNHPAAYESVYQCRPGSREGSIFLDTDFTYYRAPEGLNTGLADRETAVFCSKFHAIVTAWDTAFQATSEADWTVGLTAGLLPCTEYHRGENVAEFGPCEPHLDVYLLDAFRDKVDWGSLTNCFRTVNRKWSPLLNLVEKRASGISLIQSMTAVGVAVEGVVSQESKRSRALAGTEAGSVQGWFRQHRVLAPYGAPWLPTYITEMKDFTGDDDAVDDQADATVHLVNHAIQSGGSMALMSGNWSPERVDLMMREETQQLDGGSQYVPARAGLIQWIHMAPQMGENPFGDRCGACQHFEREYCLIHKRRVIALDSCEHFISAGGQYG